MYVQGAGGATAAAKCSVFWKDCWEVTTLDVEVSAEPLQSVSAA